MNPVTRTLRTVLQVLTAALVVLPAAVAFADTLGVTIDGVGIAATLAAAVILVTTVQNALEQAGIIPTLGARKS